MSKRQPSIVESFSMQKDNQKLQQQIRAYERISEDISAGRDPSYDFELTKHQKSLVDGYKMLRKQNASLSQAVANLNATIERQNTQLQILREKLSNEVDKFDNYMIRQNDFNRKTLKLLQAQHPSPPSPKRKSKAGPATDQNTTILSDQQLQRLTESITPTIDVAVKALDKQTVERLLGAVDDICYGEHFRQLRAALRVDDAESYEGLRRRVQERWTRDDVRACLLELLLGDRMEYSVVERQFLHGVLYAMLGGYSLVRRGGVALEIRHRGRRHAIQLTG